MRADGPLSTAVSRTRSRGRCARADRPASAASRLRGALELSGAGPATPPQAADLHLVNGRFHTMDTPACRVAGLDQERTLCRRRQQPQRGIRAESISAAAPSSRASSTHTTIYRPGREPPWWYATPLEHVFTIPDCIAALKARATEAAEEDDHVRRSACRDAVRREPSAEPGRLDAVPRPALSAGRAAAARTNSEGKKWFETRGVMVAADGAITGQPPARRCRRARSCSRPRRASVGGRTYFSTSTLGITTHRDSAHHADAPAPGIVSENSMTASRFSR